MSFNPIPYSVRLQQAATCAQESLSCLNSIDWFKEVKAIDWYNEIRLVSTATLMSSVIVAAIFYAEKNYPNMPNGNAFPNWVRLPNWIWLHRLVIYFNMLALLPRSELVTLNRRRGPICASSKSHYNPRHRILLTRFEVCVYAWPSKGGVIILDHTEAADLEFLGLDPLDPPDERLSDQKDEDAFCQKLLLLGAKWWDSEARYSLLTSADEGDSRACDDLDSGKAPEPTMKERCWVSVAWPTTGGFWIIEHDTMLSGILEEDNLIPEDVARLRLARTMDERSQVLRDHFNARFYADLKDYEGHAFLNSWEEKETGEVGPLMPLNLII